MRVSLSALACPPVSFSRYTTQHAGSDDGRNQDEGGSYGGASGLVDILSFLYIKCDFTGLCVLQSGYDRLQRADEADEGS